MRKLYKPCPKDAVSHISEYLECQFMRGRFSQNWIPIPQRCFLRNFVEIGSVVLEKK